MTTNPVLMSISFESKISWIQFLNAPPRSRVGNGCDLVHERYRLSRRMQLTDIITPGDEKITGIVKVGFRAESETTHIVKWRRGREELQAARGLDGIHRSTPKNGILLVQMKRSLRVEVNN